MTEVSTEPYSAGGGSPPPLSRNRSFLCFAVLRLFNSAALQMLNVAVGWQVYELTNDPLDLGFVGLAQFIPVFLLFLVAGVVSDRFSRRTITAVANLIHAAIAGLFLAYSLAGGQSALPIFALLAVHGAARAFFQPTVNALLANIVAREQFAAAVAASSSVLKAGYMLGPAIGGVLIAVIGLWVYLVVAVGFAIAGLAAVPIALAGARRAAQRIDLQTVLGGFVFINKKKIVLGAITLDLLAVLFSGIMGMLPVFAKDILEVGPEGLGIMRTTPAVGSRRRHSADPRARHTPDRADTVRLDVDPRRLDRRLQPVHGVLVLDPDAGSLGRHRHAERLHPADDHAARHAGRDARPG
jgi:MFS family permease